MHSEQSHCLFSSILSYEGLEPLALSRKTTSRRRLRRRLAPRLPQRRLLPRLLQRKLTPRPRPTPRLLQRRLTRRLLQPPLVVPSLRLTLRQSPAPQVQSPTRRRLSSPRQSRQRLSAALEVPLRKTKLPPSKLARYHHL